jgi:hypothetical protein
VPVPFFVRLRLPEPPAPFSLRETVRTRQIPGSPFPAAIIHPTGGQPPTDATMLMNALAISSPSPDIQRANCATGHCGTGFQPVATPGTAIPPVESINETLATNANGDPTKSSDRDPHDQIDESTGDRRYFYHQDRHILAQQLPCGGASRPALPGPPRQGQLERGRWPPPRRPRRLRKRWLSRITEMRVVHCGGGS